MLNPMTDSDDTIYLKKASIDRSVGYLVGGIVVLVFFLLTVMGMGRLQQTISDDAKSARRVEPEQKSSEIGDTSTSAVSE